MFLTGRIPRGKARAPKISRPNEDVKESELREHLEKVRSKLKDFLKLPKNLFFEHPYFGHVTRDESPRFLVIHKEHHLKIIREILE